MAPTAAYDEIADWYENQFLAATDVGDPIGIREALTSLLGPGDGVCLEIGCGTGAYAAQIRELGRTSVGVDLSAGMLAHARSRLPVARADATRLPIRDASVDAVVAVMVHTDMPGYPAVVREAARVLRPGGTFVHIGVHPAFCGGFADRADPATVVIRPGYLDGHWTRSSWTADGVRARVGATHWPLPVLLRMFLERCDQIRKRCGQIMKSIAETPSTTSRTMAISRPFSAEAAMVAASVAGVEVSCSVLMVIP